MTFASPPVTETFGAHQMPDMYHVGPARLADLAVPDRLLAGLIATRGMHPKTQEDCTGELPRP